jgi:hypothetical protein
MAIDQQIDIRLTQDGMNEVMEDYVRKQFGDTAFPNGFKVTNVIRRKNNFLVKVVPGKANKKAASRISEKDLGA